LDSINFILLPFVKDHFLLNFYSIYTFFVA